MLCIFYYACWQPNTDHCFDKCTTLNNNNLLQYYYISFVQFLKQTFNAQKQAEASINLLGTTKEQRQSNAAAKILQLVKDSAKTTTINHQDFPISKE